MVQLEKDWWKSKTLIASAVAFAFALAHALGVMDQETLVKLEALMLPLILTFLRLGDVPIKKTGDTSQ